MDHSAKYKSDLPFKFPGKQSQFSPTKGAAPVYEESHPTEESMLH